MSGALTPRSRSRARRSTTNLADLRLAPLSNKFVESPKAAAPLRSPYGEPSDSSYSRSHSSYLQGKTAPSTPGILKRTPSRKQMSGGLSRRESSFYEDAQDDLQYHYAARGPKIGERPEDVPRAKSDASLAQQQVQREPGRGPNKHKHTSSLSRSVTSISSRDNGRGEDSWFTHTSATASALLQENKGQSWLASRDAATGHHVVDSTDDDDEEYEEMAALNASTARLNLDGGEIHSPVSSRISRWGSRYGSRQGSRMASRKTSPTGTRTPGNRTPRTPRARTSDMGSYFEMMPVDDATPTVEQPAFIRRPDETDDEEDSREVARLTSEQTFGLGSVVDKFMNFNLFRGDATDTEDDEVSQRYPRNETAEEAKIRMEAENQRKRLAKERLVALAPVPQGSKDGQGESYAWADAAWLLSVASKALF